MSTSPAIDLQALEALDEAGLRAQVQRLLGEVAQRDALLAAQAAQAERASTTLQFKDATIEKLKFELARYKRWAYGARTEGMTAEQRQLFEETSAEDLADLEARLARIQAEQDALKGAQGEPPKAPRTPKREKLPEHLPRVEVHHEPASTVCANEACGQAMERIGEDISERLDIVPAEFRVERHIRGKWVCRCCQAQGQDTLVQEPAEPHLIDGGIPTTGLLAHVLVQRFVDHLPYHRQEAIHARAGVHTPRSTLASWAGQAASELLPLYDAHRAFVLQAQVLHADETPVKMLDPGRGKTAKAYVWAYARGEFDPTPGVIYEFRGGRSGHHAAEFLKDWRGTLVTDAYSGYAQLFATGAGRTRAGCLAHARRKFEELAPVSPMALEALGRIAQLYRVEEAAKALSAEERWRTRQAHSRGLWEALHAWLIEQQKIIRPGSGPAGAIAYALKHWPMLSVFLDDGEVPIDANHVERQIKPWAMGRKAWLFAGSELAGQRAAMVMSLVQSAKLCGHEPWAYLKDVLARLLSHPNHRIDELLPHRWAGSPRAATT